jgi:hypothetical protein
MGCIRQRTKQLGRFAQQSGQRRRGTWDSQPKHDIERVQGGPALAHGFAKKPPNIIALDCTSELLLADDESDATGRAFRGRREQLEMRPVEPPTCLEQTGKCRRAPKSVALVRAYRQGRGQRGVGCAGCRVQTASRTRPFARRARRTLRPPILFMRARKPCVRLRRTTEGW